MDFLSNPEFWAAIVGLVTMIVGGSKAKWAGGRRFKTINRVIDATKRTYR
jgi:hypothetical protein